MIVCEAFANAQVNFALGADVVASDAKRRLATARSAVSVLFDMLCVVLLGQCNRRIGSSACMHCLSIGSEELHQRMHELFSEIELLRALLPNRPELEGGRKRRRGSRGGSSQHC